MTVITIQEGSRKEVTSLAAATGRPEGGTKGVGDGVIRHAADPTAYAKPDADQSRVVRSGRVRGTVIPSAGGQWSSKGFNARVSAPVVNVISLDEDGRKDLGQVDLTQVTPAMSQEAVAEADFDSIDGWSKLAQKSQAKGKKVQAAAARSSFSRNAQTEGRMAQEEDTAGVVDQQSLVSQLVSQNQQLLALVGQRGDTVSRSPIDVNGNVPAQSGWSAEAFAMLGLNFLTPLASKPRERVVFRSAMGSHSTRYHAVEVSGAALLLIFDGRCDEYDQFIPEQTADHQTIKVTLVNQENASYDVVVPGVKWTIGCLDVVLMLIRDVVDQPLAVDPNNTVEEM